MCEILSVSTKTGYAILKKGSVQHLKVGRSYRIPKAPVSYTHLDVYKRQDMSDIIFKIGPRINASGRVQSGRESVDLLLARDAKAVSYTHL